MSVVEKLGKVYHAIAHSGVVKKIVSYFKGCASVSAEEVEPSPTPKPKPKPKPERETSRRSIRQLLNFNFWN